MNENHVAPMVSVWRSEDGTHWTVQIDTTACTGSVAVDLNDGRIFWGDPETFDATTAVTAVLHAVGEAPLTHPDTIRAVVDVVHGEVRIGPSL